MFLELNGASVSAVGNGAVYDPVMTVASTDIGLADLAAALADIQALAESLTRTAEAE